MGPQGIPASAGVDEASFSADRTATEWWPQVNKENRGRPFREAKGVGDSDGRVKNATSRVFGTLVRDSDDRVENTICTARNSVCDMWVCRDWSNVNVAGPGFLSFSEISISGRVIAGVESGYI